MRIFITGASGFIGGHLVRRLAHTGHEMVCLARDPGRATPLARRGALVVTGDVTDPVSLARGMAGCDAVVHLAAVYAFWVRDTRLFEAVNVRGTANVMERALQAGVSRVVHLSTAEVFGHAAASPLSPFTEETPVAPRRDTRYARSKYAGELAAWERARRGLPLVVLYPGTVIGRGDRKPTGRYFHDLVHRRVPFSACPDTVLTVVHVEDVAEAIVAALERECGNRYLLGRHQVSLGDLTRMVCEIASVAPPRYRLPDALLLPLAGLLTGVAALTRRPPPWGLSLDLARLLRRGTRFDGRKAARELGFVYSPLGQALADAIAVGAAALPLSESPRRGASLPGSEGRPLPGRWRAG